MSQSIGLCPAELDPQRVHRLALCRVTRKLKLKHDPRHDPGLLLQRLQAALDLPGNEPAQGALADLFFALGADQTPIKTAALQLATHRLSEHVRRWFETLLRSAGALPRINPLATRWSVLAIASADMSTRARRVSADDSRALAAEVVQAVRSNDALAQEAFFHHCLTCHDNLAFMLARRALLRDMAVLPQGWDAVSEQLEQTSP